MYDELPTAQILREFIDMARQSDPWHRNEESPNYYELAQRLFKTRIMRVNDRPPNQNLTELFLEKATQVLDVIDLRQDLQVPTSAFDWEGLKQRIPASEDRLGMVLGKLALQYGARKPNTPMGTKQSMG